MDLSKAYDCLTHDLIIAKFEAYGLSKSSLSLLVDYLTSRKQRVKIGSSYSVWNEIKRGVPQGSILGFCYLISLLMIFLCLLRKVRFIILLMIIPFMTVAKTWFRTKMV